MANFRATEYLLLAAAALLLIWEWYRRPRQASLSLFIASFSCIWLLVSLFWQGATGPRDHNAFVPIVLTNLIVCSAMLITVPLFRPQRSARVWVASALLAFLWLKAYSMVHTIKFL